MKKKICIITGTRAEYGLFHNLLTQLKQDAEFELQIVVTCMHLSDEYGLTYKEIESDGFKIDEKIEILLSSDSPIGVTKSIGLGLIGFADCFSRLKPDYVAVLGDRFESFAACQAAYVARIPIIHLYGGEVTEGALDDGFRHSMSKMSQLHFVATDVYAKRLIQMGEDKSSVHNVGTLGLDNLWNIQFLSKSELKEKYKINLLNRENFLISYHPTTVYSEAENEKSILALLGALSIFNEANLIFTQPNSDSYGKLIHSHIEKFVSENTNNRFFFKNLGRINYLSMMKISDVIIGNSSSGLTEAPVLRVPTVNVGIRQKGREMSQSVVCVAENKQDILNGIKKVLTSEFAVVVKESHPVYGIGGNVASNIIQKIKTFTKETKKSFIDLKFEY